MAFPPTTPLREVCEKCDWKNEEIIVSDVRFSHNTKCPKCGNNVITREITFFEQIQLGLQKGFPFFK